MSSIELNSAKALEQWFLDQDGYLHPSITINPSHRSCPHTDSGIHYCATGDIKSGENIAHAPAFIALSYLNALVDDDYPVFAQQRHRFKVEAIGFWYLMVQYVNREHSFWKPYLEALPSPDSDLTQPLFFEDEGDIAYLEGTDVWFTSEARRDVYWEYYESGLKIFSEAGVDISLYTWRLFRWAVAIFTSRSFISRSIAPREGQHWDVYKTTASGERSKVTLDMTDVPAEDLVFGVLWPGLDAANHDHNSKVDWIFLRGEFGFSPADVAMPIESGSEVFNNYGQKGNGELLLGYGFCLPDNPFDTVAVTLKQPTSELEVAIKQARRNYFTSDGEWSVEKMTFQLGRLHETSSDFWDLFGRLPEPMLELLLYMIRHERGQPFTVEENAASYLTAPPSAGRKHAPHIARMIFVAVSRKLQALNDSQPSGSLGTQKQIHASIYRQSQIEICTTYALFMKDFVRSPIRSFEAKSRPTGVWMLDARSLHDLLYQYDVISDSFLEGIEVNTHSADFDELWLAGWEEELFILLLCSALLSESLHKPGNDWLRDSLEDYLLLLDTSSASQPRFDDERGEQEYEKARELLKFVRNAANTCAEDGVWADEQWNLELIMRVGRQAIERDSFQVMREVPQASSGVPGTGQAMKCYICLYFAPVSTEN